MSEKKYRLEQKELIVKANNIEEIKQIIENEYYTSVNMKVKDLKNMVGKDDYGRCNLRWYSHDIYFSNRNFNKKGKKLDLMAYLREDIDLIYTEQKNKQIIERNENLKKEIEYRKLKEIEEKKKETQLRDLRIQIENCNIELGTSHTVPYDFVGLMNQKYLHIGTYTQEIKSENINAIIFEVWDEQYHYIPKPKNEKKYLLQTTEQYIELKNKTQLKKEAKIYEQNELIKTICLVDLYLNYKVKSKSESEYQYYDNLSDLYSDNDNLNLPKVAEWYKKKDWKNHKSTKKIKPKENELYVDARGFKNNRWEGTYQTNNSQNIYEIPATSINMAELESLLMALNDIPNKKIKYDVLMDNEWVINGLNGASYSNNWTQFEEILSHSNFNSIQKVNRSIVERMWN